MSCARISREVIEFFRFGDLDARSAPHLEHLAVCAACREEVGLDRELVIQLQRALTARVEGHAASPGAWLEIRRRALESERTGLFGRLLPGFRLAPLGAIVIVLIALLASSNLGPFRVAPSLPTTEPTWRNFQADASNDGADPFGGQWWLAYQSASAPSAPATGVLPTVDPGEALIALAERVGGPVR